MRKFLRNNGLSLALFGLFSISISLQSVAGMHKHNQEQLDHGKPAITYLDYVTSDDFLESVAENWESEFLSIFCMVTFAIWLREKGSSESKPVEAPHDQTGE